MKNNINDKCVIGARSLSEVFTFINAAYTVHENMRGHKIVAMSMSGGIIHGKVPKHQINVKSSTEA